MTKAEFIKVHGVGYNCELQQNLESDLNEVIYEELIKFLDWYQPDNKKMNYDDIQEYLNQTK